MSATKRPDAAAIAAAAVVDDRLDPPLRADAQRNRARLLAAARDAFAVDGYAVPIDEIARRAGVGAGTVYRHFPTKEALFEAVVVDLIEGLIAEARSLSDADDAGAAFFHLLTRAIAECASRKDLAEALTRGGIDPGVAIEPAFQELQAVLGGLLTRAQHAGAVRGDLSVDDLNAILLGCQDMERYRSDSTPLGHLSTMVCDGLRSR